MKSVTSKTNTLRRAVAVGRVEARAETIERMRANDLPKPDVLVVARVAAVSAAKRTPNVIPYCHPIPVDSVEVKFDVQAEYVEVRVAVEAIWKTGVEMEALTAVSAAALTIYDMLKPVDKNLRITGIALEEKRGGKTDYSRPVPKGFTAAIIVVSDSTFEGTREDKSGRLIRKHLEQLKIEPRYAVLPDDIDQIESELRRCVQEGTDLVITTGGTGLGPRDVTVEAARRVVDQDVPGIMEAARAYGQSRTPYAMLSRGVAGICGKTLILTLPGSSRGAEETMNALFPGILHAFPMMQGRGH